MKTKSRKPIRQLNIRNIVIGKGARTALKKLKLGIYGNVLDSIEYGNWWIPFDSYEYLDIKQHLETVVFHEFYNLPKTLKLSIKTFDTDILSFKKGH